MPRKEVVDAKSEQPMDQTVGNATQSNMGAERAPIIDPEDIDDFGGTTSGIGLRGKPSRGSRERQDY